MIAVVYRSHIGENLCWVGMLQRETRRIRAGRKVRMTPGQHGPLIPWATHVLQWLLQRDATEQSWANRNKNSPSSDWSLQLDSMKLESLVIAGQHTAVNTFSSLVLTARQAKEAGNTRNLAWCGPKVRSVTGAKS